MRGPRRAHDRAPGLFARAPSLRQYIRRPSRPIFDEDALRVRQSHVSQCIGWIEVERVLKRLDRPRQPLFGSLVPEMASSQVEIMRLDARRRLPYQLCTRFYESGPER